MPGKKFCVNIKSTLDHKNGFKKRSLKRSPTTIAKSVIKSLQSKHLKGCKARVDPSVLKYCFPEQSKNPNQLIHILFLGRHQNRINGLIDFDFDFAQESNNLKHKVG